METAAYRRHALRPKTRARKKTPFIPSLPQHDLQLLIGKLAPDERKALEFIADRADLLQTEVGDFLLVKASPALIDVLATVGAEAEDREPIMEDEKDEGMEDDRDSDNAFDVLGVVPWDQGLGGPGNIIEDREPECPAETSGRQKYIENRTTIHEHRGRGGEIRKERSYDSTKDYREVRRVKALARGLPYRREADNG